MRLVSLGDSTSCGQGVGLHLPADRCWPALLATAVPGSALVPLSRPGARVRDLRAGQLPAALAARPDVVTLLIGLNDVARGEFDAAAVRADLLFCARALSGTGATVVLGRLHDPAARLPLPAGLRREVQRRTAVVNAAVDTAACSAGVRVLDLAALPVLQRAAGFEVDRLHPSALGHHALASAAAALLGLRPLPVPAPEPARAGLLDVGAWAVRHALPWTAAHARSVVVPALRSCVPG